MTTYKYTSVRIKTKKEAINRLKMEKEYHGSNFVSGYVKYNEYDDLNKGWNTHIEVKNQVS